MLRTWMIFMVAAAALVTGCSTGGQRAATAPQTARITVGRNAITSQAVSCSQVQWLMTVRVGSDAAHLRAVLDLDAEQPEPQSVSIDNLGGFTGVANAQVGNAEAKFADGTYHITGTAQGSDPDRPGEVATEPFTADVTC